MNVKVKISDEVMQALRNNRPVVALESTIISHGMPYPKNYETALLVEETVRKSGATPATIAIINGVPTVGCSKEEIKHLAVEGTNVTKVSRRDIPFVIATKKDGATTVAATMIFANLAKIKVFATGGIGGVHRGGQDTMDVSADLEELSFTDVCVVCAGAKSILDLNLTMEYLETKGVPVVGYQTEELPAFFTRKSGLKVNYKVDTPEELAKALVVKEELNLVGGVLVANPIPEQFSMDSDYINAVIESAVKECDEKGIKGKEITPFLLDKIQKITAGSSLHSNIELVLNNAILASKIANEYCKLKEDK